MVSELMALSRDGTQSRRDGAPIRFGRSMSATRTAYATCPLCEATCGLEFEIGEGERVLRIRGDADDALSHGFVCPKGASLKPLHEDPDRLRTPLVRRNGRLEEATWDEAFAEVERRLPPLLEEHGRDAVAVYVGNPNAHNLATLLYGRVLIKSLGTRNIYSASTVDQMPKQVAAGLMFGTILSVPIPDVDRTDHLVILGANPLQSNGSLLTAPDMRGRIRRIRERGGKVVVIDPRRTRTAEHADEHHFIRPGADALLLFGLVHTIFDEGLDDPGAVGEYVDGIEVVRELARDFSPERIAGACGIEAAEIRRMARALAAAPSAAVYGRIGTCTQEFGTLASWLVDVLNVVTGNLDRPGGAMFPRAAAGQPNSLGEPGRGRGVKLGRWRTLLRLAAIAAGQGAGADVDALDDLVAAEAVRREAGRPGGAFAGSDPDEVLAQLDGRHGPERLLDLALRAGPYDLTLADLEAAPHGIDLGPLEPRIPEVLRTASGRIELAPEPIVADVERLKGALQSRRNGGIVLVGRRQLRSNNSWMHNLEPLVRGKERCTAHVHPDD